MFDHRHNAPISKFLLDTMCNEKKIIPIDEGGSDFMKVAASFLVSLFIRIFHSFSTYTYMNLPHLSKWGFPVSPSEVDA
ncbi:hypothetical protein A3Q36_15340 [Geobacillus stearothermophilus]|nr:hypothetical protein A3Q36_15340 [Geobacillus stearothermophilus]